MVDRSVSTGLEHDVNPDLSAESVAAVDPHPEPKCDHICLKDDGHVERGEPHFYGYEHPSPRRQDIIYCPACGEPFNDADEVAAHLGRWHRQDADHFVRTWWIAECSDGDWSPTLCQPGLMFSLPIWFKTEEACQDFIRGIPAGSTDDQ